MRPSSRSSLLVAQLVSLAGLAAAALPALGCKRAPPTELTVGVQSDPMGGLIGALHVIIKVAGKVVDDEVIKPPHGSKVGFPQPWEKKLTAADLSAASDAPIDLQVDALGDPSNSLPLLTRRASTRFVPGASTLLRTQIEARCVVYPVVSRGASKVPGPISGPACTAPATCIQGICQSPAVPPAALEPYAANWPTNAPDRCKPKNPGAPVLQIGTGQSYYRPMAKDQVLQAEAGPQGGHHIWIATRMKNLKQAGSTTRITGVQPDTGLAIPATTLAFGYAPDEGGFCKLYGIRYQLDNEGIDYKPFLGKPLDVTVTVTDASGTSATSTTRVNIAPTLVNP